MSEPFWRTAISDVTPNNIRIRGYAIEDLIDSATFGDVVYLLFTGRWPPTNEGRLVEAILVSSCDHGLVAPSTDATRFVASGGVPLPSAIAAGVLAIGDTHGGAIEECAKMLRDALPDEETDLATAACRLVDRMHTERKRLPGYGHPLHSKDPRVSALFKRAHQLGLAGRWVSFAREVETALEQATHRHLPLNVDGAIGALLLEMDMDPQLGKAFFVLSRVAGLAAHGHEQMTRERPFKAVNYQDVAYEGPAKRILHEESTDDRT